MIQRICILLLFCTVFIPKSNSQTIRNYSIEITCKSRTYNSTQSILEFTWPKRSPSTTTYYLYKKPKERYDWGDFYRIINSSDSTFNDTIPTSSAFEYMLEKYYGPDGFPTYGYIYAGHRLNAVTDRGAILLVIDSTHKTFLEPSFRTFKNDLIGDGWKPLISWMSPSSTVSDIKNNIVSQYNSQGDNLKSVVLIGDLAVAYSGDFSRNTAFYPPDGHVAIPGFGPSHEGAWPTDLYYGSLTESFWTDSIVNNTDGVRSENNNTPNDGKFDLTVLKELVKIQIGRIDLSNMPAFKFDVPDSNNIERELLKRYFTKNHAFRNKLVTITERCMVDDNFGIINGTYNEEFASNAYRNMSTLIGKNKTFYNGSYNYLTTLDTADYLFSFGFGGGSYTNCSGVGSTFDLAASGQEIKSVFTGFMGSFFGDWDNTNNFLRAPLAAKGNVINTFWCGRPSWYLHHMGLGETIGYSALRSQNNYDSFWSSLYAQPLSLYPNYAYFPFEIHPALMGDPSIRLQPVETPQFMQALQDSCTNNFKIVWRQASDTAIHSYYVYRSENIDSTFVLLGKTDQLFWKDNAPLSGDNVYMVRAEKLQMSGSGTYFNLSQGVFDTANVSNYYEPLVNAGKDTLVCLDQVQLIGEHIEQENTTYNWLPGNYPSDTISIPINSAGNRILFATDTLTGCIQSDTVDIQTIALPSVETVQTSSDVCSDTVSWSSTSANGASYIYDWTFYSGFPADSSGFGLINPGRVIYGTTGNFNTLLSIRDTQTGCARRISQDIEILCVGLSVTWANLQCLQNGNNSSIKFNIIDYHKIKQLSIEGLDENGNWIVLKQFEIHKNGVFEVSLGEMLGISAIKLNAIQFDGSTEELDICYWNTNQVDLYATPNPVESNFSLTLNDNFLNTESVVKVYNNVGLPIFETVHNFETGQLNIDCLQWPHGVYTIHVYNSKISKTIQIIK